ncbi:MAG: proton-conducting transporter membrane subunit [Paludibaculum sp.]
MLFLVVGVIYERRHTREIKEYGGLAHVMPNYAIIFAIAMLSRRGLPLLNGFVGEFTILQGAFEANRVVGGASPAAASSSARLICCGCTSGRCWARSPMKRTRRCRI